MKRKLPARNLFDESWLMFINFPSSQFPTSTHPSLLVVNNLTGAKWRWLEIELKRFSPPTATPAPHFILWCYKLDWQLSYPLDGNFDANHARISGRKAFMFLSDDGDESSCDITKRKNIQNNAKQEWGKCRAKEAKKLGSEKSARLRRRLFFMPSEHKTERCWCWWWRRRKFNESFLCFRLELVVFLYK